MLKSPCFGCIPPARNAECHGICLKYKEFEQMNAKQREHYARQKEINHYKRDETIKGRQISLEKKHRWK